jgi:hypothetical protein
MTIATQQEEAQVFPWRLVRPLTGCLKTARRRPTTNGRYLLSEQDREMAKAATCIQERSAV